MKRRKVVMFACMISALGLLLLPPPAKAASSSCSVPNDMTCQSYCPGNLIAFCDYTFRFRHCETSSASCDVGGCPGPYGENCCNMQTGEGCYTDPPPTQYCATEKITCNFY